MLYSFLISLVDTFSFLNVFKYLTVRTGLAMFTSMVVVFLVGSPFIKFFSSKQIHNPIRDDGPEKHIIKKIGTPTMGGILILLGLFSGVLLWAELSTRRAIELQPDFIEARSNLVRILIDRGKFKEARLCSDQIMSIRSWSIIGSYSFNYEMKLD